MKVKIFHKNEMRQNVYLYHGEKNGYIIDTGSGDTDFEQLASYIEEKNLTIKAILITHGHFDHIAGAHTLKELTGAKVYCHRLEKDMLEDPKQNLSVMAGLNISAAADDILEEEYEIFTILHVPGHSAGSVCYYDAENGVLFSGDVLFRDAIGRTDLPGCNHAELINGIKEKLLTLPDETKVYPGHGFGTTIDHEKKNNPFLR